ncbi:hypothetical protein GCM10009850_064390 [Nonomuraea monospora]|uniref:Uncharacterized protein n=1 Tax=Nonomuraea monospora TaxID=568818 RepID=A0ABP5PJV0_9ACTN
MSEGAERDATPPPRRSVWRRALLVAGVVLLYAALLATGVLSFLLTDASVR